MRGLSRHFRLEAVLGQSCELRKLLREHDVDLVERGLQLVEIEVLELESARENDATVVDPIARMHELPRVQLEEGAEELYGGGSLFDVSDVHSHHDERRVDSDRDRWHSPACLDQERRRASIHRLKSALQA